MLVINFKFIDINCIIIVRYGNENYMKKTNFDTINKQFEKDDKKPCEGMRVVLSVWILSFLILNIIRNRISFIPVGLICSILSFLVYLLMVKKSDISVKERRFLKSFAIYPLLILLTEIASVLNLQSVYSKLPLSYLIAFAAIYSIYSYFHDKKYVYLLMVDMLFIVLDIVLNAQMSLFINNALIMMFLFIAVLMMKEEL